MKIKSKSGVIYLKIKLKKIIGKQKLAIEAIDTQRASPTFIEHIPLSAVIGVAAVIAILGLGPILFPWSPANLSTVSLFQEALSEPIITAGFGGTNSLRYGQDQSLGPIPIILAVLGTLSYIEALKKKEKKDLYPINTRESVWYLLGFSVMTSMVVMYWLVGPLGLLIALGFWLLEGLFTIGIAWLKNPKYSKKSRLWNNLPDLVAENMVAWWAEIWDLTKIGWPRFKYIKRKELLENNLTYGAIEDKDGDGDLNYIARTLNSARENQLQDYEPEETKLLNVFLNRHHLINSEKAIETALKIAVRSPFVILHSLILTSLILIALNVGFGAEGLPNWIFGNDIQQWKRYLKLAFVTFTGPPLLYHFIAHELLHNLTNPDPLTTRTPPISSYPLANGESQHNMDRPDRSLGKIVPAFQYPLQTARRISQILGPNLQLGVGRKILQEAVHSTYGQIKFSSTPKADLGDRPHYVIKVPVGATEEQVQKTMKSLNIKDESQVSTITPADNLLEMLEDLSENKERFTSLNLLITEEDFASLILDWAHIPSFLEIFNIVPMDLSLEKLTPPIEFSGFMDQVIAELHTAVSQ